MATAYSSNEDVTTSGNLTQLPNHRYNTRSSTENPRSPDWRYTLDPPMFSRPNTPTESRKHSRPFGFQKPKPPPQPSRDQPSGEPTQSDADEQDVESQSDMMDDQMSYSNYNPGKAPFPSPAMKATQPFYPFPSSQSSAQFSVSDGGRGGQPQHGNGINGQGILVEAANRAQMAILIDDMGGMGFEKMEQS
jgi:hypothetical protein